MSDERRRVTLECVDCHHKIKGEVDSAIEGMRLHTRELHGRELIFGREFYVRRKWTEADYVMNRALLCPELISCA